MVCENCGTVFCWDQADESPQDGRQRKRFCTEQCKKRASVKRKNNPDIQVLLTEKEERRLQACREKQKKPYRNLAEAKTVATRVFSQLGTALYPYECPCGFWHLTRQPQDTPVEYEWFKVFDGSPAFRRWLEREAMQNS